MAIEFAVFNLPYPQRSKSNKEVLFLFLIFNAYLSLRKISKMYDNYLGKPQKKKSSFFSGRATKRGGGGKGRALKEKKNFF